MRLLFYFGHPAQFHFYKNIVDRLNSNHDILLYIKSKDVLEELVKQKGWPHINVNPKKRGHGKFQIGWSMLSRTIRLAGEINRNKPDILIASDPSISQLGFLFGIPSLNFIDDDYDSVGYYANLTYPFTKSIITPHTVRVGKWEDKRISYKGYMKLAYLHPNWFKPDEEKINQYKGKQFSLVRLASLTAHHDEGAKGVSNKTLKKIISMLEKQGDVIISAEGKLDEEFEKYRFNIPVQDIHHYLKFAKILVSDSQSMSGEAAMLGTPSVRISSFVGKLSVLDELEHSYNLTYAFNPDDESGIIKKVEELINEPDMENIFQTRKQKMLNEKIDVASFATWFIENWPESNQIMQENPDYQDRFK